MMTEVKGKVALSIVTIRMSIIELKELLFQQPFNAHRAPHALLYTTCTIVHLALYVHNIQYLLINSTVYKLKETLSVYCCTVHCLSTGK